MCAVTLDQFQVFCLVILVLSVHGFFGFGKEDMTPKNLNYLWNPFERIHFFRSEISCAGFKS